MTRVLVLAPALALALLAPTVLATDATVSLDSAAGAWNGRSEATADNGTALVWVPAGARVHDVLAVSSDGNTSGASWRAQGPDALLVGVPPGASTARVDFDFAGSALVLARYVAPARVDRLTIDITAPAGQRVDSPDASFTDAGNQDFQAELTSLAPGHGVTMRVVDADRVGELPILAALVVVAVVVFLLTLLWHQLVPPAPRDPEHEMRFLDHLVELQARIVPPVLWFALLNVFFFVAGLRVVHVGPAPVVVPTFTTHGSLAVRAFDAFAERQVPAGVTLVVLRPIDAVLAELEIALFLAFATVLPLLLFEIASFVGPALRAREQRIATRVIPLVVLLFALGGAFGYLVMSPLMIRTLYGFAPGVGATALLGVGDLVGFALVVVLAFGLSFELPVVMFALSRFGVVRARTWRQYLRHAILAIFIVAAVITPDPTVISQFLVAVPVTVLYLIGMGVAEWGERRRSGVQTEPAAA